MAFRYYFAENMVMIKHIAIIFLVALINCAPVYTITDYLDNWKLNLETEYQKNINHRNTEEDLETDSISSSVQKIICSIYPPIRQHSIENVYIISNRKPNIEFINYYGLKPVLIDSDKKIQGCSKYLLFEFDYKNEKCKYSKSNYVCIILNFKYYQSKNWKINIKYKILCDKNLNPVLIKQIGDYSRTYAI